MRPFARVCGVKISRISLGTVLDHIALFALYARSHHTSTTFLVNAYSLALATRDPEHRANLKDAYCLADGWPIAWLAKTDRIAGADLMLAAARDPHTSRLRHVILGGYGVALDAAQAQWKVVPDRTGLTAPFIPEHTLPEDLLQWAQIPCDVLWVALGCPKQEAWVTEHRHEIPAKVVIGIGAAVDFLSGRVQRAPRWVQSIGMEWAYRIYAEPHRWRRQMDGVLGLTWALLTEPFPWVR